MAKSTQQPGKGRDLLTWAALAVAILVPMGFAVTSPLLAWRSPVYIVAGFAGVVGMALLLVQPLLARGLLPAHAMRQRRAHRWVGAALVLAIVIHVVGLWITSPPDVVDALTFTSPTPFSAWGVVAMWAAFAAALFAALRRRLQMAPRTWRLGHTALALIVVIGSAVHALLIDGTMEAVSKALLSGLAVLATLYAAAHLRVSNR